MPVLQRLRNFPDDRSALDLLDDAVARLRAAPLSVWLSYYMGTVPFVIGVLFFWADMSRSAFAPARLPGASLLLALLFLWMKTWQSIFAMNLRRDVLAGEEQGAEPWTVRAILRIAVTQAILQPPGLIAIPFAILITIPFPWVYAFFQNVTCLGGDAEKGVGGIVRRASRLGALWPKQNILFNTAISLFGFFVYLNIVLALVWFPSLIKMFTGVESALTRSPWAFLNSTFFAVTFGLTYLCVDPLIKAAYALRCFQGESLETGKDLWGELRALSRAAVLLAAIFAIGSMPFARAEPQQSAAQEQRPAAQSASIPPAELERAIDETLRDPRYAWRMPREGVEADDGKSKSWFNRFIDGIADQIQRMMRTAGRWMERIARKFGDMMQSKSEREHHQGDGFGFFDFVEIAIYAIAILVLAILVFLVVKAIYSRSRVVVNALPEAMPLAPDLRDESVSADLLPSEGWLALAREMLAKGEYRLAMRSIFLATLAALAQENLLSIRKSKTNFDYVLELRRRAHTRPELLAHFGRNLNLFESAWYGRLPVDAEQVEEFMTRYERMRNTHGI